MRRAVIADKSKKVRQAAAAVLERDLNLGVFEISRADQLVATVEEEDPKFLVVALDMVSEVGAKQVERLRRQHPGMNVLFLLADDRAGGELRDLLAPGSTDFLSKPVDRVRLLHRLRVLQAMTKDVAPREMNPRRDTRHEAILRSLHDPESGRLDAKRVARFLHIPLKALAAGLERNYQTVHKTPDAVPLQADLQTLRRLIELLLGLVGDEGAARIWLNTPSRDLAGKTPTELITSGHAASVRAVLENVAAGAPS